MAEAIAHSMTAAQLADKLGYARLWFAEHHNTPELGASATSVLIGRAASLTGSIRVGSGGIMLPNHAPLRVAEEFGTLAQLFPDRIDLGLGRAPGTDAMTASALGRTAADLSSFAGNIQDLSGWLTATKGWPQAFQLAVASPPGQTFPSGPWFQHQRRCRSGLSRPALLRRFALLSGGDAFRPGGVPANLQPKLTHGKS